MNVASEETKLLQACADRVNALLPDSWMVDTSGPDSSIDPGCRPDGHLRITAPTGVTTDIVVEIKLLIRDVAGTARQALWLGEQTGRPPAVVATYLGAPARAELDRMGVGYVDSTGWIRLRVDSTGLYVSGTGAGRHPRSGSSPTETTRLDGPGACRIVETLLDLPAQRLVGMGVRSLAAEASTSPGMATRVLATLENDGALTRTQDRKIDQVHRLAVLDRWTQDYQVLRSHRHVHHLLAPRGLERLEEALNSHPEVTVSGVSAGRRRLPSGVVPVVPTTRSLAYSLEPTVTANELGLMATEPSSANCILVEPRRPWSPPADGVVGLGRNLADLMTVPGRERALADQIIDRLARHDDTWKSP